MNLDSAIFYSHDIAKVIPFYTELGFTIEYQHEKFVSFIFANKVRLGIKTQSEEREIPGHQTVFIQAEDIDSLYAKVKEKFEVYKELMDKPWGKEFSLLDPDKNKVLFIKRNSV